MASTLGSAVTLAFLCSQMQGSPKDSIGTKTLINKCSEAITHFSEFKLTQVNRIKVLAWYRDRLQGGWFLDCALCWAELNTEHGTRWAIVHMARNPKQRGAKNPVQEWWIYFVTDVGNDWLHYYDKPPKNSEIYGSFQYFNWVPEVGDTRYSSHLDRNEWTTVIGEAPTKSP